MATLIIDKIKLTNASDESIEFGRHFKLYEEIDLSGLNADVNYSESSSDGASYQNTRLSTRDIEIPFFIHRTIEDDTFIEIKRQEVYRVCNPQKNPIRIDFTTKNGIAYYVTAEITSTPTFGIGFEKANNVWNKGLLHFKCADPYLYEKNITVVQVAAWTSNFEFPLELFNEGIEIGYKSPSLIANVYNSGANDTGMLIRFKALTAVLNPSLININTYETFKLNIEMLAGDIIEVSTYNKRKYAKLIRNNITTSVFGKVDYSSTFLQLATGDNLFRYDADDGLDNLEVSMIFTNKYLGV